MRTAPAPTSSSEDAVATQLLQMIGGGWTTQVIGAAAELGLPDHLSGGQNTAAQTLAQSLQCEPQAMLRLLQALATLGLVEGDGAKGFRLTPLGAQLRSDARPGLRAHALWWARYLWPLWGRLADSVRTGTSARALNTGRDGFSHLQADPQAAAVFHRSMSEVTQRVANELALQPAFATASTVADLGGGYGELMTALLTVHPQLQGIVLDQAHAAEGAAAHARQTGLGQRMCFVEGSFFEPLPFTADVLVLKSILHDWNDMQAAQVLARCRDAIPAHGTLLIIERLLPAHYTGAPAEHLVLRSDLNMLVGLGGRERCRDTFDALLARAGFELAGASPISLAYWVLEAKPKATGPAGAPRP